MLWVHNMLARVGVDQGRRRVGRGVDVWSRDKQVKGWEAQGALLQALFLLFLFGNWYSLLPISFF